MGIIFLKNIRMGKTVIGKSKALGKLEVRRTAAAVNTHQSLPKLLVPPLNTRNIQ
jgi:hypothetical protein